MKNYDSHIYLYAKKWYKRTDIIEDLKKLIGHRCGYDACHVSLEEILVVLGTIAWRHMDEYQFTELLKGIDPQNIWKVGGDNKSTPELRTILKLLSILSSAQVNEGDKILIELDEPDYSILPKNGDLYENIS